MPNLRNFIPARCPGNGSPYPEIAAGLPSAQTRNWHGFETIFRVKLLLMARPKSMPSRKSPINGKPMPAASSGSLDHKELLNVLTAVRNGNFNVRMSAGDDTLSRKICDTLNEIISLNEKMMLEFTRAGNTIGKQGKLTQRIELPNTKGAWRTGVESLNALISDLVHPTIEIAHVISSVAKGNLSQEMPLAIGGHALQGEFGRIAKEVNDMVKQLNLFSSEVTRVALEVGTEGKLGGQAQVKGVAGTWKDLTDSVNMMASNLTNQVRGIAKVVTAVATGNLKQKLTIVSRGEVAQLIETINEMIDTLATFADQVTTVAREVGVEGKLGGQASVPGASGIWKNLTENVNQLAQNLTTQVRAISEVASAVTKGDLTRTIRVEAKGEVESLKDTINQMITNLRETTLRNQEQDWLKSNLAKFGQMLQGQRDLKTVAQRILSELAQVVRAHYGAFYILKQQEEATDLKLHLFAAYGYKSEKNIPNEFSIGEGLVGQVAFEKERIILTNVPGNYIRISSALGKAKPANLIILPVLFENNVKAVIELASLDIFNETNLDFLSQLTESIGIVLNTIEANSRTEELLMQSQSLAGELKIQQEELRRTNDELQDKALLLVKQKNEVEAKNKEVEEARRSLEEKAEQLTLTSKYKSEFLANMSHELRTPLNSLLILAQQLYENVEGNLTEKQIRYARTIHSCGDDLIQLINDILDLSKIESGFITANISPVRFAEIAAFVETTFKPISEARHLRFTIETDKDLPEFVETDLQRLNQILKNLLSNSFKFTEKGEVKLRIYQANRNWKPGSFTLDNAKRVVAFAISDTGIGIPFDKQNIIFEAFQQAEGSTSRKYGGTGLGLSISRGLTELLGGTIELESQPSKGSTFTLFLPIENVTGIATREAPDTFNDYQYQLGSGKSEIDSLLNSIRAGNEAPESKNLDIINEMINDAGDDRNSIQANDKVVLIVEDDLRFGKIIIDKAHEFGLKAVVATNYIEVFDFVNRFTPIAITLDVKLPDTSGWKVLDLLRNDLNYRHIPIHLVSGEENRQLALKRGARSFLLKPLDNDQLHELLKDITDFNQKNIKRILVVEDNELDSSQIVKMLESDTLQVTIAPTGKKAVAQINSKEYDCIILDYTLPDIPGPELLDQVAQTKPRNTPVIIYSAKDFNKKELHHLSSASNTVLLKGVSSLEHLLEETVLRLHINHKDLLPEKRRVIENIRMKEDILTGKNILVVDDDVRNLFALTTVFERYNVNVTTAESGKEAINIIRDDNPRIDMVLMDIMMPEMDGYETMQKIRREHKNSTLPIIAVTAKAMKGDRQKCIEAGASDYITKPLKIDQLLSLMRVWFYK